MTIGKWENFSKDTYNHRYFSLLEFPRWDFTDAEITVPSADEDPEPSPVLSLKPAVDHNIALHVPLLPASLSFSFPPSLSLVYRTLAISFVQSNFCLFVCLLLYRELLHVRFHCVFGFYGAFACVNALRPQH